ncbi:MAG TPA: THxN family PEP-CTERM protein [Rhodocyclaceae bacterium]|nr:THxN family PEP-CTERM protein [Rhodocyclaceae bacterium]
MKKLNGLIAAAVTSLACAGVQAAPVTSWGYQVETKWINPITFTAGGGTQTITDSVISWGGSGALIVGGGNRSGVLIENASQSGSITTDDMTPQLTNTFSHINNPLSTSHATLRRATIESTLTLTPADPVGAAFPPDTLKFSINFSETPNRNGECVDAAQSVCDDIFVISFDALDNEFVYDGYKYYVSIVQKDGALVPLGNDACAQAGVANGCLGFLTKEREKTSIDFGILITSNPLLVVSEPGALALAGLGLFGLGLIRRRKAA